ncbi:hypothetical protein A7K91_00645 [Paenibacillus oryzae]|uniref:Uncharacterized protein n=1 Tax=Paenibacillus oryzae TaxID=1844972 RepID=A0A1A5YI11_9BACL|nr:hypothetical protein A7K91_00645 [Paenibacillus oryzae]
MDIILALLFYRSPQVSFCDEEIKEFDTIFNAAIHGDGLIKYTSLFPKQRFLLYISMNKNVLMHGSTQKSIAEFEPRRQTLYNGKYVEAVFATKDGVWPVFYSIFNKDKLAGNFRNGCLETRSGKKFYFFSITKETYMNSPWTQGMIYFLPRESFERARKEIISFDEWISEEPVKPMAKIEVDLTDFYFMDRVSIHKAKEPVLKTWLLYKWRNLFSG